MGGHVVSSTTRKPASVNANPSPMSARNLERWVQGIVARVYEQRVSTKWRPPRKSLSSTRSPTNSILCQAARRFLHARRKIRLAQRPEARLRRRWQQRLPLASPISPRASACISASHSGKYATRLRRHRRLQRVAKETKAKIELFTDPREGRRGRASCLTPIPWTSIGLRSRGKIRSEVFKPYQVNRKLMALAARDSIFMHCLPAHRGYEVTNENSRWLALRRADQSENRNVRAKAILHTLLSLDFRLNEIVFLKLRISPITKRGL